MGIRGEVSRGDATRRSARSAAAGFVAAGVLLGLGWAPAASAGPGGPPLRPRPPVVCGSTVTKNLTLRADLDCTGQTGTAVLVVGRDHVHIDLNGFSIRNTRGFTHVVHIEGRKGVDVRDGSIEGGTEYAVVVKDSRNTRLHRLEVHGSGVPGSDFGAAVEVDGARDLDLDRVTVQSNNADGAHLHAASDVRIKRSVFRANGGDGLWVNRGTTGLRIDHSEFTGSLVDDGFDAIDTGTIDIRNSTFSGNPGRGIELDRIGSLRLHSVTLRTNGGEGLSLDTIAAMHLHRVTAASNGGDGIRVANNTGPVKRYRIEHSTSSANGGDGFDVQFPVRSRSNRAFGNGGSNIVP